MALQPLNSSLPPTIEWHDDTLYLLDQTRLPQVCVVEAADSVDAVWRAIHELRVRGAPAIGVAAAYGLCVAMQQERQASRDAFLARLEHHAAYLDSARPTAVNLRWALERMRAHARGVAAQTSTELYAALVAEAMRIHREDIELCARIGEQGRALIAAGSGVLTHCNAGALATTGIGTATAPLYCAHRDGESFRVYADETRPLLQGARLTAYELQQAGLDVTLITDSMAPTLMAQGLIDLVIVGTDRVVANGDVANKVGTLGVAIAAKHFGIPFYVACPSSTLDLRTAWGADIVIEERGADEVAQFAGRRIAPKGIQVRNPAFDVTPHALVTGIVTELGIVRAPFEANLAALFAKGEDA
ncbi:Methylthioribose-1-phosphate isomerase 1 [Paraburkholderia ribeironis]|uniref:Methylthioribose-1-phosphate isomerase n=1 Tax=Paraburkholderia ribeironis TaxID=1247936 RepID=A0A1N7S8U3_9BURK|nr:S-methyl-5-thioribose-1-phosphate isomerase [Paraburkholderia ribeironis]SIT43407.1 Methylthioribose-1-phosphate isomerase 1 [Paraburkholderia ribeironis]